MKIKLFISILLIAATTFAQDSNIPKLIGTNGTNFFEYEFSLTNAKERYAEATNTKNTFILRYRSDKMFGYPEDIDDVLIYDDYFESQGKDFEVVYTANLDDATAQENLDGITFLINNGVTVRCVEFGNEYYSGQQANFVFSVYQAAFEPLFTLIKNTYSTLPVSIFLAPRPSQNTDGTLSNIPGGANGHATFNNAVIAYLNSSACRSIDQVSIHTYFNGNEFSGYLTLPPVAVYNPIYYYPDQDDFFLDMYNECTASSLWPNTMTYMRYNMPGRKYNFTEFGIDNSGEFRNNFSYSAVMFHTWNKYYANDMGCMLIHNGNGEVGLFRSKKSLDDPALDPTLGVETTEFLMFELFNKAESEITRDLLTYSMTTADTYYLYYINTGNTYTYTFNTPNLTRSFVELNYIQGKHMYSSSGRMNWWSDGSVPNSEITSISNLQYNSNISSISIPDTSFGIMKVMLTDMVDVCGF